MKGRKMRTFQIEIWKILKVLDGRGLTITDKDLINKGLDFFNKFQDNGTKLFLRKDKNEYSYSFIIVGRKHRNTYTVQHKKDF